MMQEKQHPFWLAAGTGFIVAVQRSARNAALRCGMKICGFCVNLQPGGGFSMVSTGSLMSNVDLRFVSLRMRFFSIWSVFETVVGIITGLSDRSKRGLPRVTGASGSWAGCSGVAAATMNMVVAFSATAQNQHRRQIGMRSKIEALRSVIWLENQMTGVRL
jgi:hypothetical protein